MKRILFFLIHIILTAALSAQTIYTVCDPMPKREVRGVWLTTLSGLDWPKEKATSEIMPLFLQNVSPPDLRIHAVTSRCGAFRSPLQARHTSRR